MLVLEYDALDLPAAGAPGAQLEADDNEELEGKAAAPIAGRRRGSADISGPSQPRLGLPPSRRSMPKVSRTRTPLTHLRSSASSCDSVRKTSGTMMRLCSLTMILKPVVVESTLKMPR